MRAGARQVQGTLQPALEAEKQHLFANVLLRQGKFDEAVALLRNWRGPTDWMAYAQFNLGVMAAARPRWSPAVDALAEQLHGAGIRT